SHVEAPPSVVEVGGNLTAHSASMRNNAQDPLTAISPISSGGVLTEPPNGTQRDSAPAARTARSIDTRSLAIVNSRSGSARAPSGTARPEAPTENTPLTGLTPERRPATSPAQPPPAAAASSRPQPARPRPT